MEDTVAYMVLGYIAATIIMLALLGYLVLKARNLRAEIALLEALEAEQKAEKTAENEIGSTVAHEWRSPA